MGKIRFSSPWDMLLFDCKSLLPVASKMEQLQWTLEDASIDGLHCYFVDSFYPVHVLIHLCLETWSFHFFLSPDKVIVSDQ